MCMITPWTENQTLTITEQLEKGVRYFDLRISYSPRDGQLYLSHTLLTMNTVSSVFNEFRQFIEKNEQTVGLILIHIRVDYQARSNGSIIQSILRPFLEYNHPWILDRSQLDRGGETLSFDSVCSIPKMLLYCSDGTIQDKHVISMDLMPTLCFWNAGTVEECERRLQHMETEFAAQKNGPFLFPNQRMFMFDFSNTWPLWFTDRQQFALMEKYKDAILAYGPSILAGNHVEKIMALFPH